MLDVRRLRVLCAVADHASLSAAAEALHYSPSAVSQSVVALEREVGARLLHRGARGVQLTATGRTLVDHARPILAGLEAAAAAAADVAGLRRGRLQLASFATAGATILPEAIAAFAARFPDIALSLVEAGPDAAMALLRAGDADLILTADADPELDLPPGVEMVRLLADPLDAVLPAGHDLAGRTEIALEELAGETWVDTPQASEARRLLVAACARAGFRPDVRFESDDYATVQQLVAAGVGVALIPRLARGLAPERVRIVPLAPPGVVRQIAAAVHAPEFRAPSANAMLEILRDVGARRGQELVERRAVRA
jgi:DNA-binding transcriptional LysR family regulator